MGAQKKKTDKWILEIEKERQSFLLTFQHSHHLTQTVSPSINIYVQELCIKGGAVKTEIALRDESGLIFRHYTDDQDALSVRENMVMSNSIFTFQRSFD